MNNPRPPADEDATNGPSPQPLPTELVGQGGPPPEILEKAVQATNPEVEDTNARFGEKAGQDVTRPSQSANAFERKIDPASVVEPARASVLDDELGDATGEVDYDHDARKHPIPAESLFNATLGASSLGDFEWNEPIGDWPDLIVSGDNGTSDHDAAWDDTFHVDPRTFDQFDDPADTIDPTTVRFSISASDFNDLCQVLSSIAPQRKGDGQAKCTLSPTHFRVQSFSGSMFVEFVVPCGERRPDITRGQRIAFSTSLSELITANDAILGEVFFTYYSTDLDSSNDPKRRLDLASSGFERPLMVLNSPTIASWAEMARNTLSLESRTIFDASLCRAALGLVATVASPNQIRDSFNQIDFRDGSVIGGTPFVIAKGRAEQLSHLNLRVQLRFVESLSKTLALCSRETALLETEKFYVIRGDRIAFGFEKCAHPFPAVDFLEAFDPQDRVLLARRHLIDATKAALEATEGSSDSRIRLRVRGSGMIRAHLTAASRSGKRVRVAVDGERRGPEGQITIPVNGQNLHAICSCCESPNVELYLSPERLMFRDEQNGVDMRFYLTSLARNSRAGSPPFVANERK